MKRLLAAGLFVIGLAVAGGFSGPVIADITTSTSSTTTATTTAADTTTAATTTTATTTTSAATIPAGVRVAGVRVGGLSPAEAVAAVQAAFSTPLPVVVDRNRLVLDPRVYASAYIPTAVAKARIAAPGTNVKLVVAVRGAPLQAWVTKVLHRFARPAVDATLRFRGERPLISDDRAGRALGRATATRRIAAALAANSRLPVRLRTARVLPTVTAESFREVIVIDRSTNRLYLYDRVKLHRTFAVATGQAIYPTPRGTFHIVVKWKNPWWYPPTQDSWAKGLKPVPPGPDNPLGTRWMGISAPGVGIHGTDAPSSIGYSLSHGCIRMQVPGRRMAVRPRRDRDDRPHRLMRAVRVAAVAAVLALLGLLVWDVAHQRNKGIAAKVDRGETVAAPVLRLPRIDGGPILRSRGLPWQGRGRQLLGLVVRRVQARGEDAPRRSRPLARTRRS